MNFKDNKAIYLQIADRIGDQILAGILTPDGKVPSVRELAAEIEVNANTVARTYDHLQHSGIIYTKRGLGYFVSPDAQEKIVASPFGHQNGDSVTFPHACQVDCPGNQPVQQIW